MPVRSPADHRRKEGDMKQKLALLLVVIVSALASPAGAQADFGGGPDPPGCPPVICR